MTPPGLLAQNAGVVEVDAMCLGDGVFGDGGLLGMQQTTGSTMLLHPGGEAVGGLAYVDLAAIGTWDLVHDAARRTGGSGILRETKNGGKFVLGFKKRVYVETTKNTGNALRATAHVGNDGVDTGCLLTGRDTRIRQRLEESSNRRFRKVVRAQYLFQTRNLFFLGLRTARDASSTTV